MEVIYIQLLILFAQSGCQLSSLDSIQSHSTFARVSKNILYIFVSEIAGVHKWKKKIQFQILLTDTCTVLCCKTHQNNSLLRYKNIKEVKRNIERMMTVNDED